MLGFLSISLYGYVIGFLLFTGMIANVGALHTIDPRKNIWVTWANQTGRSSFCLSLASASDPFRTCLFGMPFNSVYKLNLLFAGWVSSSCGNEIIISNTSACLIKALNTSLPQSPQELDLMGSLSVRNTSDNGTQTCFMLGTFHSGLSAHQSHDLSRWTNVTSRTPGFNYKNVGDYCGTNNTNNQSLGAYGAEVKLSSPGIWVNNTARALPPGVFLICGDRAWPGIPVRAFGGPCYIGSLTLLSPSFLQLFNLTSSRKQKRSLNQLSSDCDDKVELWGRTATVFGSIVPGVGTAQALTSIRKLACWAVKQSNVTTRVIAELAQDVGSLRHAVLQNRAAIDFLLLAQGHGCKDFDGMCCFNLSDHSNSIHKQLQWLTDHTKKVTVATSPIHSWLQSIFGSISEWALSYIKEGLRWILTVIVILVIARVAFSCITRRVNTTTKKALLAQNKNRGIVEDWLEMRGHMNMAKAMDELLKYKTTAKV
ncbi:uncharacterized protein LOC127474841 [Manacus candei]|uniref:uncharacterized protein LOC127474841 n=1 Tax=Manacus candei TaxID=415023 RepID=UPI002226352B|nr:uncharacterized protein LOC127474841 [Manacus candei]